MANKINKCCSIFCGFITFLSGLVYLFLTIGLMAYCYVFFADTKAEACRGNVPLGTFVTITDLIQITLLLTTGCLGMVAGRRQTNSLIESYMIMATIAFFVSSISLTISAINVYATSSDGNYTENIVGAYSSVGTDLRTGNVSYLATEIIYLLANAFGFVFTLLSSMVACKAACTSPKVDVINDIPMRRY